MIRNRSLLLFASVLLALGLLLGLSQAIKPAQAAQPPKVENAGALQAGMPRPELDRVTVGEAYQQDGPVDPGAPGVCTPDLPTIDGKNMVAYWPMDDSAGAVTFEEKFNNLDGGCTAPACPASGVGLVSNAFMFDGSDDRIDAPDNAVFAFNEPDSFSIEVWVKTELGHQCTGNEVFVSKPRGTDELNFASWWVGCDGNGNRAAFSLRDNLGDSQLISSTVAINDGQWHHVVAVWDSAADYMRLYVDSIQESELQNFFAGNFTNDAAINIGYYNADPYYNFQGWIDEVAVYNRQITLAEITTHYNTRKGQSYCTDAPTAVDDSGPFTVAEDPPAGSPLVISQASLLANDTDVDYNDQVDFSAANTPSTNGGTVAVNGSNVEYRPAANFNGTDTFTYTVVDGYSLIDSAVVTVTVTPVNDTPVITQPVNQAHPENTVISSLTIQVTHPDTGDPLTFSAANLPPGLSINPSTGVISGTISYEAAAGSPYNVSVTAKDSANASDTKSFTWTVTNVNRAPVLTAPEDQSSAEGELIDVQIVVQELDAGDPLTFTAVGLPDGLSIDSTGKISGTIGYDASAGSPYSVEVTVEDAGGLSDTETFAWTVTNTNRAPQVTTPEGKTNKVGDVVSLKITASDPDGDNVTFTASNLPPGLNIHPTQGTISGTVASYANGTYKVEVKVSDGALETKVEFNWTVGKHQNFLPLLLFNVNRG